MRRADRGDSTRVSRCALVHILWSAAKLCLAQCGRDIPQIVCCGGRGNVHTPMEQPSHFNQKQREVFAPMLADAKKREAERESDSDFNDRIERDVLPALAKGHGASQLIAKKRNLQKELDDAENALGKLGFDCDEDDISLKYDAPKVLSKALEDAQRSARKERDAALKKYDLAILGVWAAEGVPEGRRIVEELL